MRKHIIVKANKSLPKKNSKKTFKVSASKYQVGDYVEYDSNWRGINPKIGQGKIIQIKPGLAGHGDTSPNDIYVFKRPDGSKFSLDAPAIIRKVESSTSIRAKLDTVKSKITCGKGFIGENRYSELMSKLVQDTDGFMTHYTLYFDWLDEKFIFILGDKELYTPENTEPDYECESDKEAEEWWDSFDGYEDDDIYSATNVKAAGSLFRRADAGQIVLTSDGSCIFNVFENGKQIDSQRLAYGDTPYDNCSWRVSYSSPSFPYVGDKLKEIANHYGLTLQDIEFKLSGNKYYGAPLDQKDLNSFMNNYVNGYIPKDVKSSTNVMAYDEKGLDSLWEEIQSISQEFTSENTSINQNKLPAIFKLAHFEPGTINVDYGGGRFDNVAEYLAQVDVINLVFDPYNRSSEHNKEVIETVRKAGGADTATCSNVLNVIKEPEVRQNVMKNIQTLTKNGGKVYFTVYEGKGDGKEGPTKSGYQLNRKTADYMEEIQKVFPDAKRKGKLIIATNGSSGSVESATRINASVGSFNISDVFNVAIETIDDSIADVNSIQGPNNRVPYEHFAINVYDVGFSIVCVSDNGIEIYDDAGEMLASSKSLEDFKNYCQGINNNGYQMVDEYEGRYSANAATDVKGAWGNNIPEPNLDPPAYRTPDEEDPSEEEIEVDFDTIIIMDKDGIWEYEDDSYSWAEGPGTNGDWYTEDGVLIADVGTVVESIDDMLQTRLPLDAGRYHISGNASLIFKIDGTVVYPSEYDGIGDEIDTSNSNSEFDIQQSDIKNFRYEIIE